LEIPPEEMEICLSVLQRIADARGTIPRSARFNSLVSKVYREGKRLDQLSQREKQRTEDRALKAETAMVRIQRDAVAPAEAVAALPPPDRAEVRHLNQPEACYICKAEYTELHFFYHLLCPKCADFNYRMRHLRADLTGRTALVTGGRVKIGHQTVLRLLRDGARVIVTTRFPHAAARRLHAEPDSAEWMDRVHVYGLDLRNIPAVEGFARHLLDTEPSLDILIHNAAQTIRRPHGFYDELLALEQRPHEKLPLEARQLVMSDAPSTLTIADTSTLLPAVLPTVKDVLPADALEDNEERADSRDVNSWLLRLDEVGAAEMLEVQLVNSVAPFLLNSRLKALMMRSPFARRFIVNVSAMEGSVRPAQDRVPPAYQHGEGGAEHDDPHLRRGLRPGRHLYEQRGHGLGHRRKPDAEADARAGGAWLLPAARHCGRHGAHLPPHRAGYQRPVGAVLRALPEGLRPLPLVATTGRGTRPGRRRSGRWSAARPRRSRAGRRRRRPGRCPRAPARTAGGPARASGTSGSSPPLPCGR
jgi:Dehydrogenases with different specificities (related to short-chain alcohol dehydrogenases)